MTAGDEHASDNTTVEPLREKGGAARTGSAWWRDLAWRHWQSVAVLMASVLVVGALYVLPSQGRAGSFLFLGAVGALAVFLGLRNPILASFYVLATTFFRLAIPHVTPVDPFVLAFAGVVVAMSIWVVKGRHQLAALGGIEFLIGAYILWNVISMISPHPYSAAEAFALPGFSVARFVLIGTVMPLTMFMVGRLAFDSETAIRRLLWALVLGGAYSAAMSIMQIHGPKSLVWPRYILHNPSWPDRAVGVFNQPVVNGIVLIYGFLAALLLASQAGRARWITATAVVVASTSAYAIYLTHTRAVWVAFFVVLVVGVIWAKGFRLGFAIGLTGVSVGAFAQWSTLISSNRAAGGVGSVSEIQDRMNIIATSIWAIEQRPLFGWGIGRFAVVNTYHHQQWSTATPWIRGFGIASHFNELGIFVELGLIGLLLWLSILILVGFRLVRNFRTAPIDGLTNRPLALTAIMVLGVQITAGLTVDLRLFDFPNIIAFMLAGVAVGCGDRRAGQLVTVPGDGDLYRRYSSDGKSRERYLPPVDARTRVGDNR